MLHLVIIAPYALASLSGQVMFVALFLLDGHSQAVLYLAAIHFLSEMSHLITRMHYSVVDISNFLSLVFFHNHGM